MSGAPRTGRSPKRSSTKAARALSQARGAKRDRRQLLAGIVVLAVLVGVVAVGVAVSSGGSAPPAAIPVQHVATGYPVAAQGGVVVAGKPGAATVVDVYEDYLCPACGLFEAQQDTSIRQALDAGRVTVRYHPVNLLNDLSRPPGYSLDAANAAICAAETGVYPSYHASLFATQPKEGGAGYPDDALIALGRELGAGGGFEQCVRSGAHDDQVKANLAGADAALQAQGGFRGTPTVLVDGMVVDVLSQEGAARLHQAIGAAG
jgi:protein-disulfide isomerase